MSGPSDIVTLTLNPAIDISTSVEHVVPIRKLRCKPAKYDPGGGGINVARVLKRFGIDPLAIYAAGGPTGDLLTGLVKREGVRGQVIKTVETTRQDVTVLDEEKGEQYRFVLPGPPLGDGERTAIIDAVVALRGLVSVFVVSGSLPAGVPANFLAEIVACAKSIGSRVVLDASGAALEAAVAAGVYLVKPNLGELRSLTGLELKTEADQLGACRRLLTEGRAEIVALTLAERGALVVSATGAWRATAPPVRPVSTVGAGDSFLGAMIWSLASGHTLDIAARYGVAAGTAALVSPGTELSLRKDVDRLVRHITAEQIDDQPAATT